MSDIPRIPRIPPDASSSPMGPLLAMLGSILPGADAMFDRLSDAGSAAAARVERALTAIERIAEDVSAIRSALENRVGRCPLPGGGTIEVGDDQR